MLIGSIVGAIIGIVMATIISGLIILLVGKLGLGIEVAGLRAAFLTAFFIALMWAFAAFLWNLIGYTPAGGITGAITHQIHTAGFLYGIRNSVSGLQVKGWGGAILAATAIAVVTWLLGLVVGGIVRV
jgi:uncharacterized membrane protein YvlD (DUF360 family)